MIHAHNLRIPMRNKGEPSHRADPIQSRVQNVGYFRPPDLFWIQSMCYIVPST